MAEASLEALGLDEGAVFCVPASTPALEAFGRMAIDQKSSLGLTDADGKLVSRGWAETGPRRSAAGFRTSVMPGNIALGSCAWPCQGRFPATRAFVCLPLHISSPCLISLPQSPLPLQVGNLSASDLRGLATPEDFAALLKPAGEYQAAQVRSQEEGVGPQGQCLELAAHLLARNTHPSAAIPHILKLPAAF